MKELKDALRAWDGDPTAKSLLKEAAAALAKAEAELDLCRTPNSVKARDAFYQALQGGSIL